MHDFKIRMHVLSSDDMEVGVRMGKTETECTPGDPANFLRTLQMLGDAALINEAWDLSQRVVEANPNWRQMVDEMVAMSVSTD